MPHFEEESLFSIWRSVDYFSTFEVDMITKCVALIEWPSNCGSKQTVLKYIFNPEAICTVLFWRKGWLVPALLHGFRGILDCDWEERKADLYWILTFLFARNFWINSSGVMFSAKDKKVINCNLNKLTNKYTNKLKDVNFKAMWLCRTKVKTLIHVLT